MSAAKPFTIPKRLVCEAFRAVKDNAGAAGVDKETIGQFEAKLKDNLYKIWNRMSSGSYRRDACLIAASKNVSAASQGGCHSEEEWRGTDTWCAYGFGSRGSDGGQDDA